MRAHRAVRVALPAGLLLCLLLSGCIDFPLPFAAVEDVGPYWDQAKPDARLAGLWECLDTNTRVTISFTEKDGSHDFHTADRVEPGEEDGEPLLLGIVRTLHVGPHTFLLWRLSPEMLEDAKDPGLPENFCLLARYAFEGDVLAFHVTADDVMERAFRDGKWEGVLVRRKEPDDEDDADEDADEDEDAEDEDEDEDAEDEDNIWMTRLSEKSLEFLKALADDPDNWESTGRYRRAQEAPPQEGPPRDQ